MITMDNIIQKGHPTLSKIADPVKIPASSSVINTMFDMMQYLINSQNEKIAEKANLRGAVGIAAPQINISKRFFCIFTYLEDGSLLSLAIANPRYESKSDEKIYISSGEGCLSVDSSVTGKVRRHKTITFTGEVLNFKKKKLETKTMTLSGYGAIVFQHEYDHLDGIIFTSKVENNMYDAESI